MNHTSKPKEKNLILPEKSPASILSNDGDAGNVDDEEVSGGDHPIILTNPSSNTVEPVKHDTPKTYIPKGPYPGPPRRMKKKKEQEKCVEIVRGINVTMQLQDAIDVAPAFRKYMKDILTNKVTTGEGVAMITHECSASKTEMHTNSEIQEVSFYQSRLTEYHSKSLCDLGSSVNLMPLSIARKLGMANFKPTKISLVLEDVPI